MKYLKYLEHKNDDCILVQRIESDYISVLGGHLVIKEGNKQMSAEIAKEGGVIDGGCTFAFSKKDLLELKECVDKALKDFDCFRDEP